MFVLNTPYLTGSSLVFFLNGDNMQRAILESPIGFPKPFTILSQGLEQALFNSLVSLSCYHRFHLVDVA
jgi:hypothetical protein